LLMDMERLLPAPAFLSCTDIGDQYEALKDNLGQMRNVFISGERGSGREWLARLLHWHGERQNGPFVIADLPLLRHEPLQTVLVGGDAGVERHGMLQAAHGGTLVIRHPALLDHEVQISLCELLTQRGLSSTRSGKVFNIQLILVSDNPIDDLVANGTLIDEFAALFSQSCVELKPLREQHEHLDELVHALVEHHSRRHNLPSSAPETSAIAAVQAYRWDGNAQELDRSIERAVLAARGRSIEATDLGLGVVTAEDSGSMSRDLSLDEYFRFFVLRHQSSLSETELASRLGISRKALWERRQKIGLSRPS